MGTGDAATAGNTVVLVGVGGIGCELGSRIAGAHARRLLHFDADALADYPTDEVVCLAGDPENTGDMDSESMRCSAEDAAQELLDLVRPGTSVAILLCATGGQTGTVVLPTLANEFRAAQSTVVVVALEPMPFEGAGRAEMASRAIAELENVADLVLVVPNRPLGEVCDPSWPVSQAIAHLKRKAVEAIEQLVKAVRCASCVGLQPSELLRSLAMAGRGAFGVGTGSGEGRVEKAIRDACANSFLTQAACQQASAAILHLIGSSDLSLREVHAATELVAQVVARVPIQVGLTIDRSAGDAVRAVLLVTGIRPPRTEGLEEESVTAAHPAHDLTFHEGVNLAVPAFMRRRPVPHLG